MIIALYSPRPQCGKTTAAQHLADEHAFTQMRFADPLKNMLETLLSEVGIPRTKSWDYLRGNAKEDLIHELGDVTGRKLMQTLGTEWGRMAVDEDFWTQVMGAKLAQYPRGRRIVVDDMRFPNEYAMLKERGAIMVKIFRGERQIPAPGKAHSSEGGLDHHDFDFEISNNGELSVLYGKMDSIVKQESKTLYH